jgi:Rha family phage regulatory protein
MNKTEVMEKTETIAQDEAYKNGSLLYIDSREVADMVGKEHNMLLRDIRRYHLEMEKINQENSQCKIAPSDFFIKSTFTTERGKTYPCYLVTKKGCEFIAHKLTGIKGTKFTAMYINRFHDMEDIIQKQKATEKPQPQTELPWFIRQFRGRYIMLERDFIQLTGVDIRKNKKFYRQEYFKSGLDYNGWGCHDKECFKREYGFDYGDDNTMIYLTMSGVRTALQILKNDRIENLNWDACRLISDGVKKVSQQLLGDKYSVKSLINATSGMVEMKKDNGNQIRIDIHVHMH